MAHIRVDELIVIDNMEQRTILHGINADILRLVVIVRAISCELHANRASVRIDRDYLLLSAVRRVMGEIKHAIIDRAALYSVELLFERYRAQESHCFEVILKYLADIVELRGVEISASPVYRAPRDAVGQILARHIIIYPGIFERFAVIEQDEIIQMLSVNLALDRRVYIAVGAVNAADVIAAVLLGELFRHGVRPDLQAVHFIVELREPREIHRSYRAGAVEILAVIAVA